MNLVSDILVLLIVVLCALIGKKRGFIKTFFGFFGNVIAFLLASLLSKPVGEFLSTKVFYPFLKGHLLDSLEESLGDATLDFASLPQESEGILSRFGTNAEEVHSFLEQVTPSAEETTETVAQWILDPVADSAGAAVAFIALFLLFALVIRVLVKVLDLISKLPLLNFSNHFLGLSAGILQGLFLAVVVSVLFVMIEPVLKGSENEFFRSFNLESTYLISRLGKFDLFGFLN